MYVSEVWRTAIPLSTAVPTVSSGALSITLPFRYRYPVIKLMLPVEVTLIRDARVLYRAT